MARLAVSLKQPIVSKPEEDVGQVESVFIVNISVALIFYDQQCTVLAKGVSYRHLTITDYFTHQGMDNVLP